MSFFLASLFHSFHIASCLAIEHFSTKFGNTLQYKFAFFVRQTDLVSKSASVLG